MNVLADLIMAISHPASKGGIPCLKYLSDCLKQLTGSTTQQLIHERLIEEAKDKLSTTTLTVSEIAYSLGFDYPQSFSKLFKTKTEQTPLQFRAGYN